ncbi:uncharacterized protein ZC84.1-like, partial [Gigantopelta aegis]|uniref:uncharacterized protein ZC84.1-like n=1 Tax=Gigantopelta aegis TaxID=1735272 RepID=UPI001B88A3DE
MSCPSGNPMMKMKMESDSHKPGHFKCNSERGCPDGYKCMGMAYGKKLCCPSEHGMKDICSMTYNSGKQCDDESASPQQTRFYYNHRDGRCHDFTYRGCSGNENNFVSKEACEKRCHRKEKPGKCMKVKANTGKKGHCPSSCMSDADCEGDKKCCMTSCGMKCSLPYNDTVSAVCKNGFPLHKKDGDVLMCSRARRCPDGYTCHVPPADGGGYCCPEEDKPIDICHQPSDGGPCKATMRRYFFNSQTQQCEQFIYGGCRGNENNFFSLEECCNSCGGNATRCKSGVCPRPKNYLTTCARQCEVDADCHGKQICCYNGCGRKCTAPALSSNTTYNCYEYLEMAYYMMNIKTESCNIVTLPRCNRDGSWKRQQCTDTLGVCWCVDKTGTVIPGSKKRGVANCEE